jgi:hypothetical protein
MPMPRAQTGARSPGSYCTLIPMLTLIERDAR